MVEVSPGNRPTIDAYSSLGDAFFASVGPEGDFGRRLLLNPTDACNLFASGPGEIARRLDVLRGYCEAEGRDYDAIAKTVLATGNPLADRGGFLEQMAEYAKLGIDEVELIPLGDPATFAERVVAELVPALRDLG